MDKVNLTHSVSAGLDYAAIGPEHSYLRDQGRAEYTSVTDDEAMAAFDLLAREEGLCRPSSAHAIAPHGEGGAHDEEEPASGRESIRSWR